MSMPEAGSSVIAGIDTHRDFHVVAVINLLGIVLGVATFPTTRSGYLEAVSWITSFGAIDAVGVEGTGSYGKGIARVLTDAGIDVLEVIRPNRQTRRRYGKTDQVDAIAAARTVLAGEASGKPRGGYGPLESIRVLKNSRDQAQKHATATANQIWATIATAPDQIRQSTTGKTLLQIAKTAARFRIHNPATETGGTKQALKNLAKRWLSLKEETKQTGQILDQLVTQLAPPALLNEPGFGTLTIATLLITIGSNPDRIRSESSFAAICGTSPVQASSGEIKRYRLNRGGDRQANAALYRAVIVRIQHDQTTRDYIAKKQTEGHTKKEAIRCLKRYLARRCYRLITTHHNNHQQAA